MATTPNYSWPTPDNTDLVRDGAEAIRDLGNAIDATLNGLPSAAPPHFDTKPTSTAEWAIPGWAFANTVSNVCSNNQIRAIPIWCPVNVTFTQVGLEVIGTTGTSARLGLHAPDAFGRPGDLLEDFGTVSTASTGDKTIVFGSDLVLSAGTYFLSLAVTGNVGILGVDPNNAYTKPMTDMTTGPGSDNGNLLYVATSGGNTVVSDGFVNYTVGQFSLFAAQGCGVYLKVKA